MKVTVVNGTDKKGVTWAMKESFLRGLNANAQITEFCLPSDGPGFCTGCLRCLAEDETACGDAPAVARIVRALDAADLIVLAAPVYVFHTTGAMKALLDHLAYRWMPHRPGESMFRKRAVVITQCAGMGARRAARDVKDSLAWWGISDIRVVAAATKLEGGEAKAMRKAYQAGERVRRMYSRTPRVSVPTKLRFAACRMLQKQLLRQGIDSTDGRYWAERGWLGKERPWRQNV